MKRGVPDHPKLYLLQLELERLMIDHGVPAEVCRGISRTYTIGLLERMWHWCARYAIRGDIGRWPDRIIAEAVGWPYDAAQLIEALVATRWLDQVDDPAIRLVVHDVGDHADNTWRQCLVDAGLTWWDGADPRGPRGRPSSSARGEKLCGKTGGRKSKTTGSAGVTTSEPRENEWGKKFKKNSSQTQEAGIFLEKQCKPNSSETPEAGDSLEFFFKRKSTARARAYIHTTDPVLNGTLRIYDGVGQSGPDLTPDTGSDDGTMTDWLRCVSDALSQCLHGPPRPGTAVTLSAIAAETGIHPRYLIGWIVDCGRRQSIRSDGYFVKLGAQGLVKWLKDQGVIVQQPIDWEECSCGRRLARFDDAFPVCDCEYDS